MVQVISYAIRTKKDGSTFIALIISGGLEMQQSTTTGNFYCTQKTCSIPSTFDESTAKMMVGQQIDGSIERVAVDVYDYVNKRTGEVMQLQHSYAYRPVGSLDLIGHAKVEDLQLA